MESSEARSRRRGGWIGGVVVGVPAAYAVWIGFIFSFTGPPNTPYPWDEMLIVLGFFFVAPVGLAIVAGRWLGAASAGHPTRPMSPQDGPLLEMPAEFRLHAVSSERLLALWRSINMEQTRTRVSPARLAALRHAVRQAAAQRTLRLDEVPDR